MQIWGPEGGVGRRGAGPARRVAMRVLAAWRVMPFEVRLLSWTASSLKTVAVALLSGLAGVSPRACTAAIAAVAVGHAGMTITWCPFTEAGELATEIASVLIEALNATLVCSIAFAPSLANSRVVDAVMVGLTLVLLVVHMGYQAYMLLVVRIMARFYRDNRVRQRARMRVSRGVCVWLGSFTRPGEQWRLAMLSSSVTCLADPEQGQGPGGGGGDAGA